MANSTENIELVPQEVLDELKRLDSQINTTKNNFKELLKEVADVSGELQKSTSSYKDLTNLINRLNKAEDELKKTEGENAKNLNKMERLRKKLISLDSQEAKEIASLNNQIRAKNQQNKASAQLANANAKSIEALRLKVAELKKEWAKMDTGSSAFKKMSKEIDSYNQKILSAEKSIGVHGRNVGNYPELQKMGGALSGMAGKFIGVGVAVSALTGTVTSATNKIASFEQANANLASVFGKTKEEIKETTYSAKELGATTEWMASEVTSLQTELAKLGFSEGQIADMQASILQFATAMGAELGEASALAGASLRAFGMDSTETERALAVMAKGANKSALSFSYLNNSMSTIAPVAKTFGFSIEDTVTLLGSLANVGFDASSAATATRNILLNLADSNGKLAKSLGKPVKSLNGLVNGLKTLKSRGVDLATTLELTDKRSVSAFNAFLDGASSIKSLRKELSNTDGVLEKLQKDRLNTLPGSIKLLASAWEGFMLSFSESSEPMKNVVDGITNIITSITDLSRSTEESFRAQYNSVSELYTKINPLADEYTFLKSKTELNANEQKRLREIIDELSKTIPGAVTAWDKYGKAIDVNIDRVKEYIDAEKARLKYLNKDLIEETKKDIRSYEREYKRLEMNKENTELLRGNYKAGSRRYKNYTEGINDISREMSELQKKITGAEEQLASYTGRNLDEMLKQESETARYRKEFNSMNEKELQKWIEDTKKGAKEAEAAEREKWNTKPLDEWSISYKQSLQDILNNERKAKAEFISLAEEIKKNRFPEVEGNGGGVKIDSDETTKAKQRNAENEMKALEQLEAFKLKAESDANKAIVSDTNKTYEERTEALNNYTKNLISSVNKQKEAQVNALVRRTKTDLNLQDDEQARKASANQIKMIEEKASAEVDKIRRESARTSVEIEKKRVDDVIKEINRELDARERETSYQEEGEYSDLAKQYSSGLMSTELYEAKKANISRKYTLQRFDDEAEMLKKQLDTAGITSEQKESIEKRLADNRLAYNEYVNEQEIAAEEKLAEKKKQLLQDVANLANQLIQQRFENQLKSLEKESEANQEWSEKEKDRIERLEEAGAISKEQAEARKKVVDDQAQAREEQNQKKKKELLKKQAIYERTMTIAEIGWSTAQAIMAAMEWGFPMGPIFAAIAGSMGAVQTATVLATPIPEYAKGTEDHPGGLAVVGDGGKSEMVIANGKMFKTPSVDTLVDLPQHAVVLPDYNYAMAMMTAPKIPDVQEKSIDFQELTEQIKVSNKGINDIIKTIRRKAKDDRYARELGQIKHVMR